MKIHPYAIILGVAIAGMSLFALRNIVFAIIVGLIATLGIDMILRVKKDWPKKKK